MSVGMSEQTLCLLLAEESKRHQIYKDRIETANGCQSIQQVERTVPLKVWGEMLLGILGSFFGGDPFNACRAAMKAISCFLY